MVGQGALGKLRLNRITQLLAKDKTPAHGSFLPMAVLNRSEILHRLIASVEGRAKTAGKPATTPRSPVRRGLVARHPGALRIDRFFRARYNPIRPPARIY